MSIQIDHFSTVCQIRFQSDSLSIFCCSSVLATKVVWHLITPCFSKKFTSPLTTYFNINYIYTCMTQGRRNRGGGARGGRAPPPIIAQICPPPPICNVCPPPPPPICYCFLRACMYTLPFAHFLDCQISENE